MGRRYRKNQSNILGDTSFIASRLPWWGALIFGLFLFIVFYFMLPTFIEYRMSGTANSPMKDALMSVIYRRIHWSEYLGVTCGIIGSIYALRNYFFYRYASYNERSVINIVAKLLGRGVN